MTHSFFQPPEAARYALRNLRAPTCLVPPALRQPADAELVALDLLIDGGRIAAIEAAGTLPAELGPDLDASMVLPGMVDCHTHLDKGHIWPRQPNPSGDGDGASAATQRDRAARWNPDDLRRRMEFGLCTAYAKGVVAVPRPNSMRRRTSSAFQWALRSRIVAAEAPAPSPVGFAWRGQM